MVFICRRTVQDLDSTFSGQKRSHNYRIYTEVRFYYYLDEFIDLNARLGTLAYIPYVLYWNVFM